MLILGLGSNQGDRLHFLRSALASIKKIPNLSIKQVSPVYVSDALVPENAPSNWDLPYFNCAIRCETTLTPYELLQHTKNIEAELGRVRDKKWGPRVIDIDLLAWDDLIQYDEKLHIPHEHLHERPFALWPLADVAPRWIYPLPGIHQGKSAAEMVFQWGSRFEGHQAPLHTRQIQQRIDTPQLVGIINLTPDSFSDGGKFITVESVLEKVRELVAHGAEVVDIGAEATGPRAKTLTHEEEWERLQNFLSAILNERHSLLLQPKISIDTRHAETAQKVLDLGVDWINDVSGLTNPALCEIIAATSSDVVVMHNLGVPVSKSSLLSAKQDPVACVQRWAETHLEKLQKINISLDRIIFDVGIGYGKSAEQSLDLIRNIECFKNLKTRLLVGHSRKSFLQQFTASSASDRDIETVVLSLFLQQKQIDFLRVHNVEIHARAFKVACSVD